MCRIAKPKAGDVVCSWSALLLLSFTVVPLRRPYLGTGQTVQGLSEHARSCISKFMEEDNGAPIIQCRSQNWEKARRSQSGL